MEESKNPTELSGLCIREHCVLGFRHLRTGGGAWEKRLGEREVEGEWGKGGGGLGLGERIAGGDSGSERG